MLILLFLFSHLKHCQAELPTQSKIVLEDLGIIRFVFFCLLETLVEYFDVVFELFQIFLCLTNGFIIIATFGLHGI